VSTRPEFLRTVVSAALVPAAPRFPATLQKPPVLRRGDHIGLIAPASPPSNDDFALAAAHVESLGLIPAFGKYVRERDGYLAGTDAQRADDFNAMARNPKVRGIVAIRGGYGTMRILELLDYAAIARDPKVVMGFSDLTALLNAIALKSRVVTFHGPVGAHGSLWDGVARRYLEAALFSGEPYQLRFEGARPIVSGRARGTLAGGNLSLVASLAGTPYAVPATGSLFFLEETEEPPYRIDRMLTQLELAGTLPAARGVIFGRCTKCIGDAPTPSAEHVIEERLRRAGHPAIAGADVGHIARQWLLPIGVRAELDATSGTLTLLESPAAARRSVASPAPRSP
jgi:muramoyltetrapeptide carboxypeptidase